MKPEVGTPYGEDGSAKIDIKIEVDFFGKFVDKKIIQRRAEFWNMCRMTFREFKDPGGSGYYNPDYNFEAVNLTQKSILDWNLNIPYDWDCQFASKAGIDILKLYSIDRAAGYWNGINYNWPAIGATGYLPARYHLSESISGCGDTPYRFYSQQEIENFINLITTNCCPSGYNHYTSNYTKLNDEIKKAIDNGHAVISYTKYVTGKGIIDRNSFNIIYGYQPYRNNKGIMDVSHYYQLTYDENGIAKTIEDYSNGSPYFYMIPK